MAFELPPLPYDYDALEPTISKETMTVHHDKHHKAYTDKLNEGVAANLRAAGKVDRGHPRHHFYPTAADPATMAAAIGTMISSGKSMKNGGGVAPPASSPPRSKPMAASTSSRKTSTPRAWASSALAGAWLIAGADGALKVTSTPNQDNPLMDVAADKGTPLLGNDVWEHAYYLTYKNDRAAYLKAWWDVVDWDAVGARYDAA